MQRCAKSVALLVLAGHARCSMDHGDHGHSSGTMSTSSCDSLDSLPTDKAVCIDGYYPLYATMALAKGASPSSGSHHTEFHPWKLYMPNGAMPMSMTWGASCGSWLDATGLANATTGQMCVSGMYPMYTASCKANEASPLNTSHSHAVGNFTLYMPNGLPMGETSMTHGGTCPHGMMDMESAIIGGATGHAGHGATMSGGHGHGGDHSGHDHSGTATAEPAPTDPTVVLYMATLAGSIDDLSTQERMTIHKAVASAANVATSYVSMSYASASVNVYGVITVPSGTSASTISNSVSSTLGSTQAASVAFGQTVESTKVTTTTTSEATSTVTNNAISKWFSDAVALATGVLVAIIVAPSVCVCLVCVLALYCIMGRKKSTTKPAA